MRTISSSRPPPLPARPARLARATGFLAAWLLVGACGGAPPPDAPAAPEAPGEPAEPPAEPPEALPEEAPPAATPGPRVANPDTTRLAASHILLAYVGAVGAPSRVTRSRDEARALAESVRERLAAGESFAALARELSDDGTASRGGSLGGFTRGTMVESFEDAVSHLAVGELSGVVETEFGFHVIRRDALVEVHAAHLVVSWAGAERAPVGVTRTRDEARTLADAAATELAGGTPWGAVVARYSDGPLKEEGGDLGWLTRRQLAPQLDAAVFDLAVGQASPVLETPRGFHIVRRLE